MVPSAAALVLCASGAWANQLATPDGSAFAAACAGNGTFSSTGHAGDSMTGGPTATPS